MKTIIELYDEEQILNVLFTTLKKPDTVVFVGQNHIKRKREQIERFLRNKGIQTAVYCYTTNISSCEAIRETYGKIIEKFPDCVVDVSGGHDLPLVVAGLFCQEKNIPMYWYDKRQNQFMCIYGEGENVAYNEFFSPEDFLVMAGGSMLRRGHYFTKDFNPHMFDRILQIWDIFFNNSRAWARNALFLQQVSSQDTDESFGIDSPQEIRMDAQKRAKCEVDIMRKIEETGMIKNLRVTGSRISFDYESQMVKRWLNDVGIWLELYTYITAFRMDYFDSAQVSVVVDWDGKEDEAINTINEIDVILCKGITPVFISCKVGNPSGTALNEILVLAQRFGGETAKAVLVTASDFSKETPSMYQRARDLGVYVIERDDIASGKMEKRLIEITEGRAGWKQV